MEIAGMPDSNYLNYGERFLADVCREADSARRILGQLYPGGAQCASCGAPITGKKALGTFISGQRTYCSTCDSKFSPRAGTILAESKLSYAQFEMILVGLSLGLDHQRIARIATVHIDTVASWSAKIRFWESHV